jgi:PAS domain S-box-containing protein
MQERREPPALSDREREILLLAGEGLTDKEIACRLEVALGTVGTYWERLRVKLGASNKAEAVAKLLADEHRVALFELHKAHEWLRLILDAAEDYAIFMTDERGTILTWSTGVARVLGFDEIEFIGMSIDRLFTCEDLEALAPQYERKFALEHGRSHDDRWHVRKDGTEIWVRGALYRLNGSDGQVRFAKIMRDATHEYQLQDEVERLRSALETNS